MKRHPIQLSDKDQALYAELLVHITARMVEICLAPDNMHNRRVRHDRFDFKNLVLWHMFSTDFEDACEVLRNARVVCPLKDGEPEDNPNAWSAQFQIMCSEPEIHVHVHQGLPAHASPLAEVLESFLTLTTHYEGGPPNLSSRREPFDVPEDYVGTCHLLEQCEYLEGLDDQIRWTEKIAPMMHAIYAWDENGVPEQEIDEMWKTLPWTIYKRFFSHMSADGVDITSLSTVIAQFWCDGKWQEICSLDIPEDLMPHGDLPRAIALKEKFRRSGL